MAFTDNFTGANNQALESRTGWTQVEGIQVVFVNASNQLKTTVNTTPSSYKCTSQGTSDHYTQTTSAGFASTNRLGAVRLTNTANAFYPYYTGGRWWIGKITSGSNSSLGSYTVGWTAGDVTRLEFNSSNQISLYINGVLRIGPVTDTFNSTEVRQGLLSFNAGVTDPWIDDFEAGALPTPTIIPIPVGSLTVTGLVPTVNISDNTTVAVPVASLSLTGFAPSIIVAGDITVPVPVGSLGLTGLAPTIKLAITVEVPTASLGLTGFAPTVPQAIVVDVPVAQLTLTGFAPIIPAAVLIDVPTGSLSLTGFAPVVTTSVIVDIPVGALTLTGLAPVVKTDVLIDIPVGSLDLTGLVPIVKVNTIITVPTGALTLTGLAPVIGVGTVVVIPVASLDLTGLAPLVATSADIAIPVGTLLLAGQVPFVVIAPIVQPGDVAANTIVRVQSESRLTIVQAGVRTVVTPAELRVVKY